MHRSDWQWENEILERFSTLPHGRSNYKHLVRELGLKGENRQALEDALDRLARKGSLIELKGGQYVLPRCTQEYAVGRLNMHRDGYGFVIPERRGPEQRDLFVAAVNMKEALHGDRVVARLERMSPKGPEGRIIRVLERAQQRLVGRYEADGRFGGHSRPVARQVDRGA